MGDLRWFVVTSLAVAVALMLLLAPAQTAGRDPFAGETTIEGRPVCAAWVRDLTVTVGPDGRFGPGEQPRIDPTYGCVFAADGELDGRGSTVRRTP